MFGKKVDNTEVNDLRLEVGRLNKRIEQQTQAIEDAALLKEGLDNEITNLKGQIALLTTEHKKAVEILGKSVNQKVNVVLSTIGVNQFANETISVKPEPSDKENLDKFYSLMGNDRTEFYSKNKASISRALLG